jgi:plastocyanin
VRLGTALLAFALLLGACGGSEEVARAPDRDIGIELRDFRIGPQVVSTRRGELTFTVINRGRLPHNFHVKGPGGSRIGLSTMLPGRGSTGVKKFGRGTYRMVCTIANHEELGMYGRLVVR